MQPLNNRVFIYLQRTYRDQCKSDGIEWPQQAIIVVKPAATREGNLSLLHNMLSMINSNNPSQDNFPHSLEQKSVRNTCSCFYLFPGGHLPMLSGLAGKMSGFALVE